MRTRGKMIAAIFRDRLDADAAWAWLTARGYGMHEINILVADSTRANAVEHYEQSTNGANSHAIGGIATGGALGAAVGAAAAALAAIGTSSLLPDLGIVVAGPIAAALAGGGVGAVLGGVLGGLIGFGIPESNAQADAEALHAGRVAIGITPHSTNDAAAIRQRFEELHGENVISI